MCSNLSVRATGHGCNFWRMGPKMWSLWSQKLRMYSNDLRWKRWYEKSLLYVTVIWECVCCFHEDLCWKNRQYHGDDVSGLVSEFVSTSMTMNWKLLWWQWIESDVLGDVPRVNLDEPDVHSVDYEERVGPYLSIHGWYKTQMLSVCWDPLIFAILFSLEAWFVWCLVVNSFVLWLSKLMLVH